MNDDFTNVHAMAYKTDGDYQIKLINTPPTNHDEFAKVLELIDEGRQLVLWVPKEHPVILHKILPHTLSRLCACINRW